jgi:hypothetical protein
MGNILLNQTPVESISQDYGISGLQFKVPIAEQYNLKKELLKVSLVKKVSFLDKSFQDRRLVSVLSPKLADVFTTLHFPKKKAQLIVSTLNDEVLGLSEFLNTKKVVKGIQELLLVIDGNLLFKNFSSLTDGKSLLSILSLTIQNKLGLDQSFKISTRDMLKNTVVFEPSSGYSFIFDLTEQSASYYNSKTSLFENLKKDSVLVAQQAEAAEATLVDLDQSKQLLNNSSISKEQYIFTTETLKIEDINTENIHESILHGYQSKLTEIAKQSSFKGKVDLFIRPINNLASQSEIILDLKENFPVNDPKEFQSLKLLVSQVETFMNTLKVYSVPLEIQSRIKAINLTNQELSVADKASLLKSLTEVKGATSLTDNEALLFSKSLSYHECTITVEIKKDSLAAELDSMLIDSLKSHAKIPKDSLTTPEVQQSLNKLKSEVLFTNIANLSKSDSLSQFIDTQIVASTASDQFQKAFSEFVASYSNSILEMRKAKTVENLEGIQKVALVNRFGKKLNLEEFLTESPEDNEVPPKSFSISSIKNETIKHSSSRAFRTAYQEKMFEKDLYRTFTHFNADKDVPIYVRSIDIVDSSDYQTKSNTYNVSFSLPNGKTQLVKFVLPKMDVDGVMFLNGSRKAVSNQVIQKPIVKIASKGEDVVRFTTSYNRIFFSRSRNRLSQKTNDLIKFLIDSNNTKDLKGLVVNKGNAFNSNESFFNSLEMDEYSKKIVSIKFDSSSILIFDRNVFNEKNIEGFLQEHGVKISNPEQLLSELPKDYYPIGYLDGELLSTSIDNDSFMITSKKKNEPVHSEVPGLNGDFLLSSLIISLLKVKNNSDQSAFNRESQNLSTGSYAHSTLKILGMKIPLLFFLAYKDGIEPILEDLEIQYTFSDKETLSGYNNKVKFSDTNLYFKTKNYSQRLLLNGFSGFDTKEFLYNDFKKGGSGFESFFKDAGKLQAGKGLNNFYTLFIDPITKKVLNDYNLPSDLLNSFLYCNSLLVNPLYSRKNDMSEYRVRNAEFVNSVVYKILASSIERYRRMASTGLGSFSIPPNAIMLELVQSPILEEVPLLNPLKDSDSLVTTTYKGFQGAPLGHSKGTEEIRAFDKSMMGLYGVSTPDNSNVGITRKLTLNAKIASTRGRIHFDKSINQMNAADLFTASELSIPFLTHSDPPRQGMAIT